MNLRFSRGQIFILIVSVITIALAAVYMYFGVLEPLKLTRDGLVQELKMYNALSKGNAKEASASVDSENTAALQRMVPVDPLLEQYVLDLEKVEGLSGVSIQTINVQIGESPMVNISGDSTNQENTGSQVDVVQANATVDAQENEQAKAQGAAPIVWNIEIKYSVYEQLQSFLKAVEDLPRITTVSGLEFKGKTETAASGGAQETYTGAVVLTTYYVPNVQNADEYTPDLDLPPLCTNRTNPTESQTCN